MKLKKLFSLILIVMPIMFAGKVSAFSDTIGPVYSQGSVVSTNGYDILELKYYGSTAVFCTQFGNQNLPSNGSTCTKSDNWSDAVKAGVASIIKSVGTVKIEGDAPNNYYYGELAINKFLCDSDVDTAYTCKVTTLGEYESWFTNAKNVRDNYKTAELELSTSTLTFTKSGDNYISNNVTITKKSFDDGFKISSTKGSVVQDKNNFYIQIPASEITDGTSNTVTVTVSISKSVNMAQNYSCGSKQSITPNIVEAKTLSDSATATGTISKTKLIINKVDSDNKFVPGATLKITGTQGYSKTVTTTNQAIVLSDLVFDTYTITEVSAPAGYSKLNESKKVTLSSTSLTQTVTLTNSLTETQISKLDATGQNELPGATLQILDASKKSISCKIKGTDGSINESKNCSWVSTDNPTIVVGLTAGKYYLKETMAPDQYNLNKSMVEFEVKDDGSVNKVKMTNELTETIISKVNAVDGKELPGATLQILNENKQKVSCSILDENGDKKYLDVCSWVSTDKPTSIVGLPVGKYFLQETIAPEGYVLSETMVEFEVKGDGTTTQVEMKNDLEVPVPNTLSSRSALLLAIAMFDIALGIGIITYVKKNKVQE